MLVSLCESLSLPPLCFVMTCVCWDWERDGSEHGTAECVCVRGCMDVCVGMCAWVRGSMDVGLCLN